MGADFYLLPKTKLNADPVNARSWLDRENRLFAVIPTAIDLATETHKRRLADLLLKMKPNFKEAHPQYEQIAEYEKILVDEVRRKYRHIEIDGPSVQFFIFDQYIAVSVYSKVDPDEFDAILAALSAEGGFVLFDPQSDTVIDLSEESFL